MSLFKKIDRIKHDSLTNTFPDLQKLVKQDESVEYKYIAISVFDHWLSEEEAEELLGNITEVEANRRNEQFKKFNDLLLTHTEMINFTLKGRKNKHYIKFRAFSSMKNTGLYMKHFSLGRYHVVLPELQIVYFEGYDDTNFIYYKDSKLLDQIKSWASDCNLFILRTNRTNKELHLTPDTSF